MIICECPFSFGDNLYEISRAISEEKKYYWDEFRKW